MNSWKSRPPKVKKGKFIVLSDNKWACSSLLVEGFWGWRNENRGTAAMQSSHTSTGSRLIRLCCSSKGTVEENTRALGAPVPTAPRLEFHLLNVLLFTVLSRSPSLISTCSFFFFLLPTDAAFHLWQREKKRERMEGWRWEGTRNARAEGRMKAIVTSDLQQDPETHDVEAHTRCGVWAFERRKCWGELREKRKRWNERCTFFHEKMPVWLWPTFVPGN